MEFFEHSVFFGVSLSLLAYGLGVVLQKRFRLALFNPLLLSVIVTILVLVTAHIDYEVYYAGAKYLSYLLTPATVCLAVPLYEKFALLRSSWRAILAGILSGVLTTLCSVLALSLAFRLSHEEYVTLLPKSITTAIGMGVSEELGGYVTLTVAMIIITGILGNVIAVAVCRVFRITEPIAKGVAIGSAAHALGTAKAIEIGEVVHFAAVLNDSIAQQGVAGSFGWCMADYNTHREFGSGDRICYHGVMDMFRNPKLSAAVYASQKTPRSPSDIVLEVSSGMALGDLPGGVPTACWVFTNAESVRLYRGNDTVITYISKSTVVICDTGSRFGEM